MPNRLFQGIINQMRDATDRIIGVVDESGTVISCSELGLIGEIRKGVIAAGVFNGAQICVDSCTYKAFGDSVHPEYAVFVDGTDEMSRHFADIIAVALDQIKKNNDEKFDRSNFVKNVILDNILPGDIYIKSRELRFNNELARHKLLDLLGDFALLGKRIKGRVWATRPGHFANTEFMKQVKQTIRREGEKPRFQYDCHKPPVYDINDIRRMLPHRPPFLLVDRIFYIDDTMVAGI